MDETEVFEAERPRLVGIASRVLGDHAEAEDVVQQAWLRLHLTDATIENLPAWLTTSHSPTPSASPSTSCSTGSRHGSGSRSCSTTASVSSSPRSRRSSTP